MSKTKLQNLPLPNFYILNLGFSLIELLVVMGIIGIMATTTVAIFSRFNQQQNITIASKNVRNDLAEAKSLALSQVIYHCKDASDSTFDISEDTAGILRGYQSSGTAGSRIYSLYELCETPSGVEPLPLFVKEKTLPSGVTFVESFSINFSSLTGGSQGGTVTITSTSVPEQIEIGVTSEGVIQ